ncbi:hypothetical protein Tco_0039222, partial [Tanacetum coccineum]
KAKDAQAKEIASLKKRVQKLERKKEIKNCKQSAKVDEKEVSTGIEDSDTPTILATTTGKGVTATKIDEITLAQTLIENKAAKPRVVNTAAITTTTTRLKARGVVVQEPSEFKTTTSSPQESQPSKTKDKGKAIMIDPEVPLKKKYHVALDEKMARNLAILLLKTKAKQ